jgi:hypothetical protein
MNIMKKDKSWTSPEERKEPGLDISPMDSLEIILPAFIIQKS